jgi:signal transduction histidine kinase/ligand-binding sensor domain-containing protein
MLKHKFCYCRRVTAGFILFILFSCNYNTTEVPFPGKENGFLKPFTVPLQFTLEKVLQWDTSAKGGIKPVVKKLDLNLLPSLPYDSSGFKPFTQPIQFKFDPGKLPETSFKINDLTAKPLQFKKKVLAAPAVIKTLSPTLQKDKPLAILDLGQLHGLPAKLVTCLLKDRHGLMWIASTEGVFRYDGEHLRVFVPGPIRKIINGMAEDDDGNIWFIQPDGINMINPAEGTISTSSQVAGVPNNLTTIFKDRNGLLWVNNSIDHGVSIINPREQTFKTLDTKTGLSDSSAFQVLQDRSRNIWITTSAGADIIDTQSGKIKNLKKVNGLLSDTLTAITMDSTGLIWISAAIGGGLCSIDLSKGIINQYRLYSPEKNSFTFGLSVDNKGRLWRSTYSGLRIIDVKNNLIKQVGKTNGLVNDIILSCTQDDNKRMWVATVEGLNIIDQNAELVHPLGQTVIITMMNDGAGTLWVGTDKGIALINEQKNELRWLNKTNGLSNEFIQSFTKYKQEVCVTSNGGLDVIDLVNKTIEHTGKKEGLVNDTTYAVFKDDDANTWLTGPSNGVNLIDADKKILKHADVSGGLSDNNVQDVRQDKNGLIWLATNRGGINVFNPGTGTVKYLNNLPGLKDTCSKMLLLDKHGRMWIGTDKGIYIADTRLNTVTSLTVGNGLPSNRILSLLEYGESVIAGTNNKSAIITAPTYAKETKGTLASEWQIAILDKSEGFVRQQNGAWNTDCISPSGEYLWGDRGLTIINDVRPKKDSALTYITGMTVMTQPQQFKNKPALKDKDTLWAADTFYVKGMDLKRSDNNSSASWDHVAGPYNMPVDLTLPYQQNYIQFQFTRAHLGSLDTTRYRYILEGIDKNWSAVTTSTTTENYLNLPPGKYSFKVSSESGNQWSAPAVLNFTITPPWYKTWWAYTLFVLIGVAVIRSYIVYRSRQLRKENRLLEEKVNERTNELRQSLENLKATQAQLIQSEKMASLGELTAGIAHEIQNPLNFINNFSEVNAELIAEMKEEIEKGNLEEGKAIADDIAANEEKITHHGKRADGIVKGMLQHSRTGNRQKEATDINALADEYLRLAYHGLRAKDKSFNAVMKTDFDETIGPVNIITQDIGRVILNLITNAFYAVAQKKKLQSDHYEPTVSVSTKKIGEKLEVKVKDNGNGIPQKVLDKIFQPFFTTKPAGEGTGLGLSLSYDIIKAHNGELKVETKEEEGAEFIIILPQ